MRTGCGRNLRGVPTSERKCSSPHTYRRNSEEGRPGTALTRDSLQVTAYSIGRKWPRFPHSGAWELQTAGAHTPEGFPDTYQLVPFFNSVLRLLRVFLRNVNDRLF